MRLFLISLLLAGRLAAQQMNPNQIRGTVVVQSLPEAQTSPQPLGVKALNGVLNAALFPGTDLGAKVSAALVVMGTTCGTVYIPNGNYTWSTQVRKLPCQRLDGDGAVIKVSAMSVPFLVSAGDPTKPASFNSVNTPGGISNITFVGPGPSAFLSNPQVGLWLGGDSTGMIAPATFQSYVETFYNLHIEGFACGVKLGITHQVTFFGGVIEGNLDGVCSVEAQENISFHGTQIFNNQNHGFLISADPNGDPEFKLYGVSLDYNTHGAIYMAGGGSMDIYGGHFEQLTHPFITVPASRNSPAINISGNANFTYGGQLMNQPYAFDIQGYNTHFTIADGLTGSVPNAQTLVELVYWHPAFGCCSLLNIGYYTIAAGVGYSVTTPTQAGAKLQLFSLPIEVRGTMQGRKVQKLVADTAQSETLAAGTLTVTAGVLPGAGLQHVRFPAACTTAATIGATCASAVHTLPVAFSDANYTLTCSLESATGVPTVSSVTKTASTVQATIAALTAAAAGGTLDCMAMHD